MLHSTILYIVSLLGYLQTINGSTHEKQYPLTRAHNEDPDQPAHPRSLIGVSSVRMKKLCVLACLKCAKWRFWRGWSESYLGAYHYENTPIQICRKFHLLISPPKLKIFRQKTLLFIFLFKCEAVLTSTYNLCFSAETRQIMYTPVNPSFTIQRWSLRGSNLYRYVLVMCPKIRFLTQRLKYLVNEMLELNLKLYDRNRAFDYKAVNMF